MWHCHTAAQNRVIPCQLDQIWRMSPGNHLRFDKIFTICLYHSEMKIMKISAFLTKGVLRDSLKKFWPISALGWFFSFGPFLRACNSKDVKDMNLKFYVYNKLIKDLLKADIWGNLVFTWLSYWMSKIEKKNSCFLSFVISDPKIPSKLSNYTKHR